MSVITKVSEPNLWVEICAEFESRQPPFEDRLKKDVQKVNYDPSIFTPVFYGKMHEKIIHEDCNLLSDTDVGVSHPACFGYTFCDEPAQAPPSPITPLPDKKTCSPRVYLEEYVFPHLLPAMEAMLTAAKKERCFERRRTKFNALDFLTEYLYKCDTCAESKSDREGLSLFDIPFVRSFLEKHPRPPLPLSLIWTEEEAALVIQSFWRGHLVRRQSEVQELRRWQREWRLENQNIRNKVDDFWADKMPSSEEQVPNPLEEADEQNNNN